MHEWESGLKKLWKKGSNLHEAVSLNAKFSGQPWSAERKEQSALR